MSAIEIICVWGIAFGALAGLALRITVPADLRQRVERLCLRSGGIGTLFMFVPAVRLSERQTATEAVVALGLLAVVPLVAGSVMYFTRMATGERDEPKKGATGV